ncbi:MAG: hypothetical protein DHS20C17_08370 [Cyclobacteriaceae bacterium]|nr:MAG: hypothetical protein DHS20C17_08370 [Cyclobacteriaceae bacterium]
MSQTIHQYFKKSFDGLLILIQLDPVKLTGVELIVDENGTTVKTDREYDQEIYQDLEADDFETGSALEFNLYLKDLRS